MSPTGSGFLPHVRIFPRRSDELSSEDRQRRARIQRVWDQSRRWAIRGLIILSTWEGFLIQRGEFLSRAHEQQLELLRQTHHVKEQLESLTYPKIDPNEEPPLLKAWREEREKRAGEVVRPDDPDYLKAKEIFSPAQAEPKDSSSIQE